MCKCDPRMRTPFCGKGNCQWPKQKKRPAPIDPGSVPDELREQLKEKLGIVKFGPKYWDYIIGEPSLGGKYPYPEAQKELDRITDDFLAFFTQYAREERLDEWNWISENMPYTDQGRLFEERARLRIAELKAKGNNSDKP